MTISIESVLAFVGSVMGSGFVLWWLTKLLNDKKETTENRVEITHLKEGHEKMEKRISEAEKEIPKIKHLDDRLKRLEDED